MYGLRACFTGHNISVFTSSTCGSSKEEFPLPQNKNGEQKSCSPLNEVFYLLYLKLEPPTNSRMILVGGISLSLTGMK